MNLKKYSLIIFDCDGTLVNTEYLYNSITAELLTEIGLAGYTPEKCIEMFAGKSWSSIHDELEKLHGIEISYDIVTKYVEVANERMAGGVEAGPGALDALKLLSKSDYKICVGSNGERRSVMNSLRHAGLFDFFHDDHIFTKIQVAHPKPAPDLFLFAAEKMGGAAEEALVIEDSPTGVLAAINAGMDVIGFTGCAHDQDLQKKRLIDAGARHIFTDLAMLREFLSLQSEDRSVKSA